MKIWGYARVSSTEQNLDRQIAALIEHGISEREIITDKASGKDFERTGYKLLKDRLLRDGDTLVVKELDRIGRNAELIKSEWHSLQSMGVDIVVLDSPILNTANKSDLEKTLISTIVFELLTYMAEKERVKIRARQAEGIAAARASGKALGRPTIPIPENFEDVYSKVQAHEITATAAMNLLDLRRNTYYRFTHQMNLH